MDKKLVANNIKKIRETFQLTQKDLAEKIHVSRSAIGLIESGRSNPTNQLINNISNSFGIRVEWIKTGEGSMKKSNKEILKEAINKINNNVEAEKAVINILLEKEIAENDKETGSDFYISLLKLKKAYENADRDTKGYLKIQLERTFSDYL